MSGLSVFKKLSKLVFVTLSSLFLFTTFFTVQALAKAKDDLGELPSAYEKSSVCEAIQDGCEFCQNVANAVADTLADDAAHLFDISDTERAYADTSNASDNPKACENDSSIKAGSHVLESLSAAHGTPSNDAISYDAETQTVTIAGDCTDVQIHIFMNAGAGVNATTLHFSSASVIQMTMNDHSFGAPFANTKLQTITAEADAAVSFSGTNPMLDYMFSNCEELTDIDGLSVWDVTNITGIERMFQNCVKLFDISGLSSWNVLNVTGDDCMKSVFNGCARLSSLDALSTWDVSNVKGSSCMAHMFDSCLSLTSLDGLSAWNVSGVSGTSFMDSMFNNCTELISIDGIASWNIAAAAASFGGCVDMFAGCLKLASLTVNSGGFQLAGVSIPTTDPDLGQPYYWWPVEGTSKGITANDLITESAKIDKYGTRWVRSEENVNPYIEDVVPTVTWTTIAKPYTGFNQTIGPDKVEVDGTELRAGIDYTVRYTKTTRQRNAVTGSPTVRDKGIYTANLYLQGKYVAQKDPSCSQTVYVMEPGTVALTFIAPEGTFTSTGIDTLLLLSQVPGQALDAIESPTRTGYSVDHWEDAAGNRVSFPLTIPDANTSYTATWSANPGPGPTPPGPTPGPTPEPTPDSGSQTTADINIVPQTGDYYQVYLAFAALLLSGSCLLLAKRLVKS